MKNGILSYERLVFASTAVQAAPYVAPIHHPLGPPVVTSTSLTVDLALNNPTRITSMIMDLTLQRFFIDRVFASGGGVTGGAVIYDEWAANDLYADRDVQKVEPGAEFPILTFSRRAPKVALVEKWGGKTFITREARRRNNVAEFTRAIRQMSNTVVRKLNQRGVEVLEAAVTAGGRTVTGNNWSTVITMGASPSNWPAYPSRDFAKANEQAEVEELGINYNLWIINPQQWYQLQGIYGGAGVSLNDTLAAAGISLYVTNRVAAGTAYAVAEQMPGEMRVEQPLETETWEDSDGRQQNWIQVSVLPVFFIDNPYAILKFTGLNG
jgi:hypothetical protein